MGMRMNIAVGGVVVLVLAGVALINPAGRMILQQPTAGEDCIWVEHDPTFPANVEALDFTSPFNSENRLVNGSMIRSLSDSPRPDCTRIGDSYRCTQVGPTTVEIRAGGSRLYYGVPEGAEATIFGDARDAFCVITTPAAQ